MLNEAEDTKNVTEEEFRELVKQLKEIDFTRLLITIQTMASTVKMYKIANRLLL